MEEDIILTLTDIGKRYHSKVILEQVNLTIHKGQSVVFIGHNGTGKSTLLKIISGIVRPSTGSVDSHGRDLLYHYIPEHFPKSNLTAKEYMMQMCAIDGISKTEADTISTRLFRDFFMESMTDIPMKHLSKGTLQKVGVIQALITKPDVLLLDEPLSGQDMNSQEVFIEKMNELRRQGVTLIMSCHEKYLISKICDTVYRIEDSKLKKVALKTGQKKSYVSCIFTGADGLALPMDVERSDSVISIKRDQDFVRLIIDTEVEEPSEIVAWMLGGGWKIRGMRHE